MTMKASYFEGQGKWVRDAVDWTPESSRRGRAFTVYAALRSLGREGLADLVTAAAISRSGSRPASSSCRCELLNDVVINQVLFRFEDDETTTRPGQVQAGRRGVDGRNDLARPHGDPHLGLELAHDGERHRPHRRCVRGVADDRLT